MMRDAGGRSIDYLSHAHSMLKEHLGDSKANFHVTWGFFSSSSSLPLFIVILGFYRAFVKFSLNLWPPKAFGGLKKEIRFLKVNPNCFVCIWKMHFNHWWVNKVLWWRPNMVIVKIKKKNYTCHLIWDFYAS